MVIITTLPPSIKKKDDHKGHPYIKLLIEN